MRRYPATSVSNRDRDDTASRSSADRNLVTSLRVENRIFDQCIQGGGKPAAVGENPVVAVHRDFPRSGRGRAPAASKGNHDGFDVHALEVEESGISRRRHNEHTVGQPGQPVELAEDDFNITDQLVAIGRLRTAAGLLQKLGVTFGNRDRGSQFVRAVADELADVFRMVTDDRFLRASGFP
jgi:hypothetical protein